MIMRLIKIDTGLESLCDRQLAISTFARSSEFPDTQFATITSTILNEKVHTALTLQIFILSFLHSSVFHLFDIRKFSIYT